MARSGLLTSLALRVNADREPSYGAPPKFAELFRRLAPFNIDGRSAKLSYLAICYAHELRNAQKMGFGNPTDTVLYALSCVAMRRFSFDVVPEVTIKPEAVLYDEDGAEMYGSLLISLVRRRARETEESTESLCVALEVATVLGLLSGTSEVQDRLFAAFQNPDVIRLAPEWVDDLRRHAVALFAAGGEDRESFRELIRRELADLYMCRYAFLERYWSLDEQPGVGISAEASRDEDHAEDCGIPSARLTFTVLPDDEGVAGFLTERVRFHMRRLVGARFEVDSQRTDVLIRLATWAGWERCTLYRGSSTAETRPVEGENITEDYLVLAINHTSGGQDAVAISPARGRHATFVVRHDVSRLPWYEVFALPKRSAADLGAKRMRFQSRWPMDEYEAMFQKVISALTCPSGRFGEKFEYSDELGCYLL